MVYKLNNKLYKEVFTGLCISSNHKIINIISIVQKVLITKLVLVKINLLKKIYIINYSTQFIRKFSIYKKARLYYIYKFKSKKMTRTYKHLLKRFPNYKPIK